MCHTIAYQFCRAEKIRGQIIDSALEEGRRSNVLSSFAGKGGGVGRERGREKSIKLASYFAYFIPALGSQ